MSSHFLWVKTRIFIGASRTYTVSSLVTSLVFLVPLFPSPVCSIFYSPKEPHYHFPRNFPSCSLLLPSDHTVTHTHPLPVVYFAPTRSQLRFYFLCSAFPDTRNLGETLRYILFMTPYFFPSKRLAHLVFVYFVLGFLFCFVLLFRATPVAYGGSQARGRIRATAASLHHSHSNAGSESHICDPHHSSWQCHILKPLSEARD